MTETKQRIQDLKSALPHVREKVATVAMLFVLSLVLMVSTSYAWYTLSMAPEASSIKTTISANGSLEVALSDFDGEAPETSGVNDSFAAEGQTTHGANITWGNLINLAAGYGLESLVLRPAALDVRSESLLYGVKYSADGRVEGVASDFGFTTWYQVDKQTDKWEFVAPSGYPSAYPDGNAFGVRAISSVAYEGNQSVILQKLDNADALNRMAVTTYSDLYSKTENITLITNLVQTYLDANIDAFIEYYKDKLGGGSPTMPDAVDVELSKTDFIVPLANMMDDVYTTVCQVGDALAYLANIQVVDEANADLTREDILNLSDAQLKEKGVSLTNSLTPKNGKDPSTNRATKFLGYRALYNQVKADRDIMRQLADDSTKKTVWWSEIESVIDHLISIDTLTVNGKTVDQTIGMGTDLLDYVPSLPKTPEIVLYQGSLWNLEHIIGDYMQMPIHVELVAKYIVTLVNEKRDCIMFTSTSWHQSCMFADDKEAVEANAGNLERGIMKAQDTYGMVLDLWVRTNAENSLLTLNGTPEIETYTEQRMVLVSGESVSRPVYIYMRPTGEELNGIKGEEEVLVYIGDDGYCYDVSSYSQVYKRDESGSIVDYLTKADVINDPKMDEKTRVIGFNASNRIWQEGDTTNNPPVLNAGEISSTQGSGSCYIFYADTPEVSARSLDLLSNLKFAFVDSRGNLLSTAVMDVANVYAENGKYTVPIAISSSKYSIEDENGQTVYGICNLSKNVATRISVVVYLDGQGLENEMVMSEDSIVGSLNLQFDSTAPLTSLGDPALSYDVISLSANISQNRFEYSGDRTAVLSAVIAGMAPAKVQATFLRRINAVQGTRMQPVDLIQESGTNNWSANVTFPLPGTYVLSDLHVDGVPYALPAPIEVEVTGFNVGGVLMDESAVLTTASRITKDVTISFASNEELPTPVQARFMTEDGHSVNAELRQGANGTWTGTATFTEGGSYTLQYYVLGGEYYELPKTVDRDGDGEGDDWYRFTAYMNLTTRVYLERYIYAVDGNGDYILDADGEKTEKIGSLTYILGDDGEETSRIVASAEIFAGDEMLKNQRNVVLYYAPQGSSTVENGFSFDLTWDGEQYTGELTQAEKTGMFVFNSLRIGNTNSLTSALSAPVLTVQSKDPPSFNVSAVTDGATLVSSTKNIYRVLLDDADTARNYVVFENRAGSQFAQPLTAVEGVFNAEFPSVGMNGQNDTWKVVKIVSAGITVKTDTSTTNYDGAYTEGADVTSDPFRVQEAAAVLTSPNKFYTVLTKDGVAIPQQSFTTINTVNLVMDNEGGKTVTLGKDTSGNVTAAFMQQQSFALSFKASAPNIDQSVLNPLLSEIQVVLKRANDSSTMGGYTIEDESADVPNDSVTLKSSTDENGGFVVQGTVSRAGTYSYTAHLTLEGTKTFSGFTSAEPALQVWSKAPTVAVSTAYYASENSKSAASYTDTSATVYFYKYVEDGGCLGSDTTHYNQPYVEITLDNVGGATSATMTFSSTSLSVNEGDTAATSEYSWTDLQSNKMCKRFIGKLVKADDGDTKTAAGTITATKLKIKSGNDTATFVVTLSTPITISNPS